MDSWASALKQIAKPPDKPPPAKAPNPPFTRQVLGLTVNYYAANEDGEKEAFLMRIVEFDAEHHLHILDSEGLSTWDGQAFTEEVDLEESVASGDVTFIDQKVWLAAVSSLDT